MPKYRQLHLKILDSFDFNEMPDDFTRVVWLLLPLIVDSEGRGIANTAWIKSKMFPLRSDVTDEQIRSAFVWLIEHKMVIEYQSDNHNYFYVPTFKLYQSGTTNEAKSNLPAPSELVQSYSGVTSELVQTNSNPSVLYCIESELYCIDNNQNSKIFTSKDAEKAYLQVTKLVSIPSDVYPRLENILDLLQHYGWDETIDRLTKALDNWRKQKRKDNGAPYKVTNPKWIDYAITGEIVGSPPELSRAERDQIELEKLLAKGQT